MTHLADELGIPRTLTSDKSTYVKTYFIGDEKIGRGGFGEVYMGILTETRPSEPETKTPMAVKIIRLGYRGLRPSMFRREHDIHKLISDEKPFSPYLVKLFGGIIRSQYGVLYMEYVAGNDLLKSARRLATMKPVEKLGVCLQMAEAVKYLHSKGIAHMDIKPGNFMLTTTGTIKLFDFGLACFSAPDALTIPGLYDLLRCEHKAKGTPNYIAPEIVKTGEIKLAESYDFRMADIFSLGHAFYYVLTQSRPYKGEDISVEDIYKFLKTGDIGRFSYMSKLPDLGPTTRKLVESMTNRDPNARPTINQVVDLLRAFE